MYHGVGVIVTYAKCTTTIAQYISSCIVCNQSISHSQSHPQSQLKKTSSVNVGLQFAMKSIALST